jgi:ADP-heptose:LPS heptosyltransferase
MTGVQRIGVFRAGMLGSMLCVVPALRALSAAWPAAELVLIGQRWARPLAERLGMVRRFIEFPGWPGLGESPSTPVALPGFLHAMQSERFDLLLQVHGSGRIENPLLAACAPRRLVGFATDDDAVLAPGDRVRWPEDGHEAERLLAVTDHLGLPRQGSELTFPLRAADREAAACQWPLLRETPRYVVVRWMPASFASVADRIAARGWRVVLTGDDSEIELTAEVRGLMKHPAVDLGGATDLWSLGALI